MPGVLFDLIFETFSEPILIIDQNQFILDCNHAACQKIGYAKEDVIGQGLSKFILTSPDNISTLDVQTTSQQESSGADPISPQPHQALSKPGPSERLIYPWMGKPAWVVHWNHLTNSSAITTQNLLQGIKAQATYKISQLFLMEISETILYQTLVEFLSFLTQSPLCALNILGAESVQSAGFFIAAHQIPDYLDPEALQAIQQANVEYCTPRDDQPSAQKPVEKDYAAKCLPEQLAIANRNIQTFPIINQSKCYALLMVEKKEPNKEFDPDERNLIRFIYEHLAIDLEKKHLTQLEKKHRKQVKILRELLQIRNTSLENATVLEQILDQLSSVIDYDSSCIMLVNEGTISVAAHRRFRAQEQLEIPLETKNFPHIEQVLQSKKPMIIRDTHQDKRWYRMPNTDYIRSWLGVPLIARDRVLGLLNLDKVQPNYYTEEDAEFALIFANQAAVSIENAQLFSYERQRVNQLDTLRITVTELSSKLELSLLLHTILERAIEFLGATGGDLGLFDDETQEIVILTSHNMGQDYKNTRMAVGEGAMGLAVQTRTPIIIRNYTSWSNASHQYRDGPWHAVIAAPLLIGDRVVGAIGIVDKHKNRQFSSLDQTMLNHFAENAAIAVENAILFKNIQGANERQVILHRVSQEIVSASLDSEGIYNAIHYAASQIMPSEAFALTMLEEANQSIRAVYLVDRSGRVPAQIIPSTHGLSGRVIRTGKSIYIPDTQAEDKNDTIHFGDTERVRSVLAVPMRLRGRVMGMLSAQSYQPNAYKEEDQHLLEMLASYAAIALENLRLFTEIQKLAITDTLTDIYNRRHLFELGQREFSRSRRLYRPLSLLMLDIDHFKEINDTLGHKAGDFALKKLAQIMKTYTREIDILGRFGGEEFVAVLVETTLEEAYHAAERLRSMIENNFKHDSTIRHLTVSIGLSDLKPETTSFYHLMDEADAAMYVAKNSGRNQVQIFHGKARA